MSVAAYAQHEHHDMNMKMDADTTSHIMSHAFSQSLPMNRNGSGTGWLPDKTPMYAYMKHGDKWMYMFHGAVFLRQNWQNLNNNYVRGGKQFDAPGWVMGMAQRKTKHNGLFLLRAMMSIDPITVGGNGYPLLFQSGETYKGIPLVNRQHPHDLFSELAVGYTQKISNDLDVSLYVAYPGEPALGPTAFMHRISALNNPDAPLGHHWQDATHITFGVATLGIRYRKFKLEGSSFTGREPDENRYNFDKPRFDSYSYRLSYAPSGNFVFQVSKAMIKSPEPFLHDDVDRTTVSAIFASRFSDNKNLTATAAWGLNKSGDHESEKSILLESNLQLSWFSVYTRYEFVEKSPTELLLNAGQELLPIHAFTLGTTYQLGSWFGTNTALGVQGTVNPIKQSLQYFYGNQSPVSVNPVSAEVYLRVIPGIMKAN